MKWIFWIMWSVIVIISLIIKILSYLILNILVFSWSFSKKHTFSWGDWAYEENMDLIEGYWAVICTPDKNPWVTFKRWSFYDDL